MERRLGIYTRAAASLVTTLALVVGLPAFLVVFVGWPLPRAVPSLTQVWDSLDRRDVSTQVLVNTLAVIAWLAWAQFTAAIAVEAVGAIWGRAVARPPGYPGVQAVAGRLVASIVVALTTVGPVRTGGAAPLTPPAVEQLAAVPVHTGQPATDGQPVPAHTQPEESPHTTHVTRRGDTFWGLARDYLGDGLRWREIRDLNVGRTVVPGRVLAPDEDRLQPGWQLLIPARTDAASSHGLPADQTAPRRPSSTDQRTSEPADDLRPPTRDSTSAEQVTVEPGDNLWSIAEQRLADRLGREPDTGETTGYWRRTVDENVDRLASGNPDLVYPGEQIIAPADPGTTQPPPAPPPDAGRPNPDAPAAPIPPTSEPPTTGPPTSTTPTTTGTGPAPSTSAPSDASPHDHTRVPAPSNGSDEDEPSWTEAIDVVPIGASAALAALTLRALARRRRARRRTARPGTTTPPRSTEDVETERALAAASGHVLDRVRDTVKLLSDPLRTLPEPPTVTGIVVDQAGDVTVHLDGPTAPIEPFIPDPASPSTWRLPAHEEAARPHDPEDEWVPVLETVVCLGHTDDGQWVFIDLESLGAISICGDREHATDLARAMVAELALQPIDHCVHLTVVAGIETPTVTEQGVLTADRLDETLVRQLQRTAEDTAAYLATEQTPSTPAGRARGLPRDGLIVTVTAIGRGTDPVLLHRLAEATLPGGRGLAVIALDPLLDPAVQLVARDGHVEVPHLGVTVAAADLTVEDLHTVDGLLAREPEAVTPVTDETVPTPASEPPGSDDLAWDYRVRVFADHRVETRDGEPISFRYGDPGVPNKNTHRGPELIAYLALRPDRSASADEIRDHLWWGRPVNKRTVGNLISGTRGVLGGPEYLSRAEGDPGHGRYRLAPTVVTDADLLARTLAKARGNVDNDPEAALALLQAALADIEAPAFRADHMGAGLAEWAAANRIVDRIQQPVIEAALLAADLATRHPDHTDTALSALDAGLLACPANEALTRAAMRLEADAGRHDAANSRYQALATDLIRDDLEPEAETTDLQTQLMSPGQRIG